MLNTKGQRELAYAVKVTNITPINGADRVELAHVNGCFGLKNTAFISNNVFAINSSRFII